MNNPFASLSEKVHDLEVRASYLETVASVLANQVIAQYSQRLRSMKRIENLEIESREVLSILADLMYAVKGLGQKPWLVTMPSSVLKRLQKELDLYPADGDVVEGSSRGSAFAGMVWGVSVFEIYIESDPVMVWGDGNPYHTEPVVYGVQLTDPGIPEVRMEGLKCTP